MRIRVKAGVVVHVEIDDSLVRDMRRLGDRLA
jgi:hypothetical protein